MAKQIEQKFLTADVGPVELVRRDVELVVERLEAIGTLSIKSTSREFESLADLLASHSPSDLPLTLEAKGEHRGSVEVTLYERSTTVKAFINEQAPASVLVSYDAIREQLQRKRRFAAKVSVEWMLYAAVATCSVMVVLARLHMAWLLLGLPNVAMSWLFLVTHKNLVLVDPQQAPLWVRRKDDVKIALLSAVVGAVLGSVGTVLVTKLLER